MRLRNLDGDAIVFAGRTQFLEIVIILIDGECFKWIWFSHFDWSLNRHRPDGRRSLHIIQLNPFNFKTFCSNMDAQKHHAVTAPVWFGTLLHIKGFVCT